MSEPRVTYAKFRELLLHLGFVETVVPESHVAFLHSESGTNVMFPLYRPGQAVLPRHFVPVRTLLDAKGLLDAGEFDRAVASSAVKQPAS